METLIELLKAAPVEAPGQSESVPMRALLGEDSPVFDWLAMNMYQNDPDMLTALLEVKILAEHIFDMIVGLAHNWP